MFHLQFDIQMFLFDDWLAETEQSFNWEDKEKLVLPVR